MAKLIKRGFVPVPVEEPAEEAVVETAAPVVEAEPAPVAPVVPVAKPSAPAGPVPNTHESGHGGVYRSTGDGRRIALRRT